MYNGSFSPEILWIMSIVSQASEKLEIPILNYANPNSPPATLETLLGTGMFLTTVLPSRG